MSEKSHTWVKRARYILSFCGLVSIISGFVVAFFLYISLDDQVLQNGEIFYIALATIFVLCLGFIFGFINLFIGRELVKKHRWAWIGGIILGVIYLLSIFFPVGGILLYSLFRAKALFEIKEAAGSQSVSDTSRDD